MGDRVYQPPDSHPDSDCYSDHHADADHHPDAVVMAYVPLCPAAFGSESIRRAQNIIRALWLELPDR